MAIKRIMLSAGHGPGQNAGAIGGYYEGTRMYTYSLLLKEELEKLDFVVGMVRKNLNENPNLTDRGKAAKAFGADLHYMLHTDAAAPAAKGVTVLYSIRRPEDRACAETITKAIAACMGTSIRAPRYKESTVARNRDWYTEIDTAVQLGVAHVLSVEHGFHTNIDDCTWLCSDENLKKLAKAEAEGICRAFGGVLPTKAEVRTGVGAPEAKTSPGPKTEAGYRVKVTAEDLNCRSGPGVSYAVNRIIRDHGVYTVVEEKNGWGRLKSGAGWINLSYTKRLDGASAPNASGGIKVGSKVRVKAGTRDYDGGRALASHVFDEVYTVLAVSGNRVVIGKGKAVTAAIHRDRLMPA